MLPRRGGGRNHPVLKIGGGVNVVSRSRSWIIQYACLSLFQHMSGRFRRVARTLLARGWILATLPTTKHRISQTKVRDAQQRILCYRRIITTEGYFNFTWGPLLWGITIGSPFYLGRIPISRKRAESRRLVERRWKKKNIYIYIFWLGSSISWLRLDINVE